MKISMLLGGILYLLRGLLLVSPLIILGFIGKYLPGSISVSTTSLTSQEPIWILGIAAIVIAFIEEHYFRDREYEAFILSLVGTAIIFLIAFFAYTYNRTGMIYAGYALFFMGIVDFVLGLEYHKPGHVGRKKVRNKPKLS
ncbi:MAG: hypothetical protein M1162_03480 [Candidatus Thermoplasmatota archaeon]|nr:hypothetical protein [Candidatus Thermoplasmatota archaeon]